MLKNTTETLLHSSRQFTFFPSCWPEFWQSDLPWRLRRTAPVPFDKKSFLDYRWIRPNGNISWVEICQLTGDNCIFILSVQLTCVCFFERARNSAGHRVAWLPLPGLTWPSREAAAVARGGVAAIRVAAVTALGAGQPVRAVLHGRQQWDRGESGNGRPQGPAASHFRCSTPPLPNTAQQHRAF